MSRNGETPSPSMQLEASRISALQQYTRGWLSLKGVDILCMQAAATRTNYISTIRVTFQAICQLNCGVLWQNANWRRVIISIGHAMSTALKRFFKERQMMFAMVHIDVTAMHRPSIYCSFPHDQFHSLDPRSSLRIEVQVFVLTINVQYH